MGGRGVYESVTPTRYRGSHTARWEDVISKPSDEHIEEIRVHRRFLAGRVHENSAEMDRIIITLAGGALILSVAFLTDIAPKPTYRWMLIVAWGLLLVAVVAVAISYWTADRSLRGSIAGIDEWMGDPDREDSGPKNRSTPYTGHLSVTGLACLVLGLALLGLFAAINFV